MRRSSDRDHPPQPHLPPYPGPGRRFEGTRAVVARYCYYLSHNAIAIAAACRHALHAA